MLARGLSATIETAENYIELKDKSDLLTSIKARIEQLKYSLEHIKDEIVGKYNTIKITLPLSLLSR